MKSALVAEPEALVLAKGKDSSGDSRVPATNRVPLPKAWSADRASTIILVGTSFKTSSLAFREALARRLARESTKLLRLSGAKEYAELVTCNRIELLLAAASAGDAERDLLEWVSHTPGMEPGSVYVRRDVEAISHLFRVAAGLDSMVIGEEQILAQVKDAGVKARTSKSSRGSLSALFDVSVSVGRRARSTLKPADDSVSSAALRFALSRLPRPPRNVLLIGTGKTTRLAASQVQGARVYVATRRSSLPSFSRATIVSHKDLRKVAAKCDLIISATKHRGYLLKRGDLGSGRRVILDLAFPRNIDPSLASGETEVYNLEDLARVFASRPASAGTETRLAEELIVSEAERFSRWLLASRHSSALSQVYQWAESTRAEEAEAALRRLPSLSKREKKVVEAMSRRLVSKLLAPPTSFVKSSTPELPQEQRLDLVEQIFERATK